ncbi:hypothetical protein [Crenothrix polyspora]|uniref:Uncharacterized protein n=1 Tax=Crenothrix polyspora TaxID=360316 RepID=A0A1R4GYF5_9GAMM|nr:hypothetical protein [Crenothrix polyspora]SJM89034.1 conserved exported hypothetical protein [Crenothrix polyspora]
MKFLKKFGLAVLIATSMGTFSTAVLAEVDEGRIAYGPEEAIDLVKAKIKIAEEGIAAKKSGEEVSGMILEALHASKEINANDKVDNARMKANTILKSAKKHAKEGNLTEASAELATATTKFEDLRYLITHGTW